MHWEMVGSDVWWDMGPSLLFSCPFSFCSTYLGSELPKELCSSPQRAVLHMETSQSCRQNDCSGEEASVSFDRTNAAYFLCDKERKKKEGKKKKKHQRALIVFK